MRNLTLAAATTAVAVALALLAPWAWGAVSASSSAYEPTLDPAGFTTTIDNPYFPLPVGRTLVYKGVKDGRSQVDRITVTNRTKRVAEGITARVVTDVATHNGQKLEETSDWYAQDKAGNVWYVGENTKQYLPNGKVDTSGSWEAGVNDAEPGLVMQANPQVLNSYRQEFLRGEAEDTAWVVSRGGTVNVPYGALKKALTTLEATRLEPGAYDRKVYAPGVGIVREQALTGTPEVAVLVSVSG